MHCLSAHRYRRFRFQSAPAIAGGRCAPMPALTNTDTWFQSAPAIAGGRCFEPTFRAWCLERFNPRPPSLAGVAGNRARMALCCQCFNPRPPSLAGVAQLLEFPRYAWRVSIRARHRWRALRRNLSPACRATRVSIRARHRWRALRFARRYKLAKKFLLALREHNCGRCNGAQETRITRKIY